MRNTLLTTTALVLTAGIASADGHATISWSGTATAGMARIGKLAGVATQNTAAVLADLELDRDAQSTNLTSSLAVLQTTTATTEAGLRSEIAGLIASVSGSETVASNAAAITALNGIIAVLDAGASTIVTEVVTGDFETYSEVNATVTGAVALDNGMSLSAGMSVDAGAGYDFADDDGFDTAVTGRVALDSITLNAGSMGSITIDQDATVHLVDADDDAAADLLYTNTFGSITVSAAVDVSTDVDDNAVKAVAAVVTSSSTGATAGDTAIRTAAVAAVAADVQWSAKVSMPVTGGTAYVAIDEEGGNAFGASTTVGGIGVSFDSKLEALGEGLSEDRSNTVGLTYVMGSVTAGATWNSVEDKDQWGITAAYAGADGMTISASTDEGSDWSISGSYLMGTGASVVGGVNYTEDAYLGLSFAF